MIFSAGWGTNKAENVFFLTHSLENGVKCAGRGVLMQVTWSVTIQFVCCHPRGLTFGANQPFICFSAWWRFQKDCCNFHSEPFELGCHILCEDIQFWVSLDLSERPGCNIGLAWHHLVCEKEIYPLDSDIQTLNNLIPSGCFLLSQVLGATLKAGPVCSFFTLSTWFWYCLLLVIDSQQTEPRTESIGSSFLVRHCS